MVWRIVACRMYRDVFFSSLKAVFLGLFRHYDTVVPVGPSPPPSRYTDTYLQRQFYLQAIRITVPT